MSPFVFKLYHVLHVSDHSRYFPYEYAQSLNPPSGRWKELSVGGASHLASIKETHACAIDYSDHLECWGGNNKEGQLDVPDLPPKSEVVSAGNQRTCGINQGELHCWGHHHGYHLP